MENGLNSKSHFQPVGDTLKRKTTITASFPRPLNRCSFSKIPSVSGMTMCSHSNDQITLDIMWLIRHYAILSYLTFVITCDVSELNSKLSLGQNNNSSANFEKRTLLDLLIKFYLKNHFYCKKFIH